MVEYINKWFFLFKFIGVQQKHWKVAAERSVLTSVRAFHFLHKCASGGSPTQRDLISTQITATVSRKTVKMVQWHHPVSLRVTILTSLAHDNTDSDSSADS